MASAARRKFTTVQQISDEVSRQIFTQLQISKVSPIPMRAEYHGDPDPKSQEFMRDKIDRAKEEAYGVAATEADYAYWTSAMSASVDQGWAPYWDDRMRGMDAGGNDVAVYGKFSAKYLSPKALKKVAANCGAAVATFSLSVGNRIRVGGDDQSGSRRPTPTELDELSALLEKGLRYDDPLIEGADRPADEGLPPPIGT